MSTLQYCIERRKAERRAFVNVLKAMPTDKLDYRPHPRSRTAAEVAWTMASEEADLVRVLDEGQVDFAETKPPATADEIVSAWERNASAVDERLAKLDEAGWNKPAKFMIGGKPVWEDTVSGFVWGFLFDAIHHRGQLSTYLRPMGGKVPAIYGPSADDPGQ